MAETNIHPIFDRTLTREEKENLLKQNGMVIWMTGLSGSGKSTIAIGLEKKLFERGILGGWLGIGQEKFLIKSINSINNKSIYCVISIYF